MTSLPKLFAAGEMTGLEGTYVGFASGFQAAEGIDRFVQSSEGVAGAI